MTQLKILVALVIVVPSAAFAQPAPVTPAEPVVVASGQGIVFAVPDRAWISISAESRAPSPREAQRLNAEAMKPVQDKQTGLNIAFLMKFSAEGELLFSNYFGGDRNEEGLALAIDSQNNVYLAGRATSTNLPVKNALQPQIGGGGETIGKRCYEQAVVQLRRCLLSHFRAS